MLNQTDDWEDITPQSGQDDWEDITHEVKNPAEQAISDRSSFIDMNRPITPKSVMQHPIAEPLRALGGGFEVAEGIPADIGLGLQNAVGSGGKSVMNIPHDIGQTLTGKRPAQFGDIYRGAGVPEPLAATGGLLSASAGGTPSGELGNIIGKAIGKPIMAGFGTIKPGLAKIMSLLSKTPSKAIETAMDNPEILNNKYIKQAGQKASQGYQQEVKPLVNDPNAVIKSTSKMGSIVKDLGWYTPDGSETRALSEVAPGEKKSLVEWAARIDNGSGGVDFNEADKVIAEIDRDLGKFYDRKYASSIPPTTKPFQRQALQIRRVVDEARKSQFSGAGKAIEDYGKYAKEKEAHELFRRLIPKTSSPGEVISSGLPGVGLGFALHSLPLGSAGLAISSPAVQGQIIKGVGKLSKNISKAPAVIPNSLKELARKRK